MKKIIIFLLIIIFSYPGWTQVQDTVGEESFLPKLYNHEKRIFLLFSPSPKDERYEEQMNILLQNRDVLTRAGVALFKLFPEEGLNPLNKSLVTANVLKLRQQFNINEEDFALMYVTVNGDVQMRQENVTGIETLLTVIDTTTYYRPDFEYDN